MNPEEEKKARKREYRKRYYIINKEKERERRKRYYYENREKLLKDAKQWHIANRDKVSARKREWRKTHLEESRENARKYNETHKEAVRERRKRYYEKHKDEISLKRRLKRQKKEACPVVVEIVKPEKPVVECQTERTLGWGYDKSGKRILRTWQEEVADRAGKKLRPVCHLGQDERENLRKPYLWYVAHGIPADEWGEVTENGKDEIAMLRDMLNREREERQEKWERERKEVLRRYGY